MHTTYNIRALHYIPFHKYYAVDPKAKEINATAVLNVSYPTDSPGEVGRSCSVETAAYVRTQRTKLYPFWDS